MLSHAPLLVPLLLLLALAHANTLPTVPAAPTCATQALTRALESSTCSTITSIAADIATQHALHCLLTHVGGAAPACLLASDPPTCLPTLPVPTYEAFRALRVRWPSLCAAAAAQRMLRSLRDAVETARRTSARDGVAERETKHTLRSAQHVATQVLEANLEMLADAPGLRRAARDAKRAKERMQDGRESRGKRQAEVAEMRKVMDEAVSGIRQAIWRVKAAAEKMEAEEIKVDRGAVAGFGDAALIACAIVAGGERAKVVMLGIGLVGGLTVTGSLVVGAPREWIKIGVWVIRAVALVVSLGWLSGDADRRVQAAASGATLERSESVEDTSPFFDDDDDMEDEDEGECDYSDQVEISK